MVFSPHLCNYDESPVSIEIHFQRQHCYNPTWCFSAVGFLHFSCTRYKDLSLSPFSSVPGAVWVWADAATFSLIPSCWCLSDTLPSVPETWPSLDSRTLWLNWFTSWVGWRRWACSWKAATLCSSASFWTSMRRYVTALPVLHISTHHHFSPVSAPAGVRHLCEVRAAPGGAAPSWSLLPRPAGPRPRQCGQTGLHHIQVGHQLLKYLLVL